MATKIAFKHPFDTHLSSGLRFSVEILAWVGGPWAVAQQSIWLAIPAVLILIGFPAIFSTSGDKKQVVVATPGPLRVSSAPRWRPEAQLRSHRTYGALHGSSGILYFLAARIADAWKL